MARGVKKRACVVVLGDFGHSPRMQNHTYSLLQRDVQVDVIATSGSLPFQELASHPHLKMHLMRPAPQFLALPRFLALVLRTIWQATVLFWTMVRYVKCPDFILVQNPPAVPVLPVVWLFTRLSFSTLVLDWHNYGHSILALNLRNRKHPLVKLYRWIEEFFGKRADIHLCVSSFMRRDLFTRIKVEAHVVYDCPTNRFNPDLSMEEAQELLTRLAQEYPVFGDGGDGNKFTTEDKEGQVVWREDGPLLVVSSTSWTEDEDMGLLLRAMHQYSQREGLPEVVCVVTGKGPLKAKFEAKLKEYDWNNVSWALIWLKTEDYPRLLACADLGVCLHISSSGVDLPMKIVDMFSAGLPVVAVNYPALSELLQPRVFGEVFSDANELTELLVRLLSEPERKTLGHFCQALRGYLKIRWEENWDLVVGPIFHLSKPQ